MLQSDLDAILTVVGGLALLFLIGLLIDLWTSGWFKRDKEER